jgi:putative addiction module component (TIGR02574 family)
MDLAAALDEMASLSVEERIRLVEAIWETIVAEPGQPELTDAQKQELQRRLAAHAAEPGKVIPWEKVKAEALARARR